MNLKIGALTAFSLAALTASLFLSSQTTKAIFTNASNPISDLNYSSETEDLKDVIVGTWDWACCKGGAYSGQIVISSLNDGEIVGNFSGAGGGSVVGHIDGNGIHFRRTSSACSSDGDYQDWTGTYNPANHTIAGTITGCNVNADEKIKSLPRFTMTRPGLQ